jgi:predicted ATP-dependent protease
VQKDGPSAGITMACSLISLALGKSLEQTVAMTGELTVTGKVLRIGGLREKTVAARRAGAKMVIFPKDNLSDWLELPQVCFFPHPPSHLIQLVNADLTSTEHQRRHRRQTSSLVQRSL